MEWVRYEVRVDFLHVARAVVPRIESMQSRLFLLSLVAPNVLPAHFGRTERC